MSPIVLDLLVVAVIALFAFLGWRRGLVLALCGLLAVFVAYGAAVFVSGAFSRDVAGILQPTIQNQIEQVMQRALDLDTPAPAPINADGSAGAAADDPLDRASLEQALYALDQSELFTGLLDDLEQAIRDGTVKVVSTASSAVSGYLALRIAQTLLFYVTFAAVLLVWGLLSKALDLACRVPVLRTFNEIGGMLLGIVKGAIIVLAAALLLSLTGLAPQETVQQTWLFRFFMDLQLL